MSKPGCNPVTVETRQNKGGSGGARKSALLRAPRANTTVSRASHITQLILHGCPLEESSENCVSHMYVLFDKQLPAQLSRLPAHSAAGQKKHIPLEDIFLLGYRARYGDNPTRTVVSSNLSFHTTVLDFSVHLPNAFHSTELRARNQPHGTNP